MSELMSIKLLPTHAEITITENNVQQTKHVSLDMLRTILSMDTVTTPLFPLHVVKYYSENSKVYIMTCEKVNVLDYFIIAGRGATDANGDPIYDTYKYHIPYIYFIWKLDIVGTGYKLVTERIYCSFREPAEDTPLYVPKIGNVYDEATICWGSNRVHVNFNDLVYLRHAQKTFLIAVHTNEMTMNSELVHNNNKMFATEAEFKASGLTKGGDATLITRFNNFIKEQR